MTCYSSSINPVPICGGPAILICVQAVADAFPQPAWVSAVCTEGEVDSFSLFSDAELTVPLVGYTIGDRVRCPESLVGATCETAMSTNLCPDTIAAIDEVVDDQTTEINAKTDEQTTAINQAIGAQTTAINQAISSQTTAFDQIIDGQTASIVAGLDDIETSVAANTNNLTTRIGDQTTTLKASIDLPQTNYSYAFTYNVEGDILTLTRNGTIGGSAVCQVKTYTYNGLSQLTGISAWVAC